jgi:long-chain fatty acid transport protein
MTAYNGILEGEYFDPGVMALVETEYDGIAGYGYNFGVIYKPTDSITAGASVVSSVPIEMEGEQKIDGIKYDSELRLRLPYYLSFGLGYTPNDKLTLGLSLCYMQYASLDEVSFTTNRIRTEIKTYYTNEWRVGIGAEYKYNEKMDIRAGLKYIPSGTERKGMAPTANDINIMAPSIGVGYDFTDTIELDLTLQYVCGIEKEYQGQKYDMDNKVMLFGIRYNK